jgi:hypothetical protein
MPEYHLLLSEGLDKETKMTAAVEHWQYKPLSPSDCMYTFLKDSPLTVHPMA